MLKAFVVTIRGVHCAILAAAATVALPSRFTTVERQVVSSSVVAEPQPNVLGSFVMPALMAVELNALRRLLDFDVIQLGDHVIEPVVETIDVGFVCFRFERRVDRVEAFSHVPE